MRAPIIALIVIYAIAILGLTLIPGVDAEAKRPRHISFLFHAFTSSATPHHDWLWRNPNTFSDASGWVTICILPNRNQLVVFNPHPDHPVSRQGFSKHADHQSFLAPDKIPKRAFLPDLWLYEAGSLIAHTFDYRNSSLRSSLKLTSYGFKNSTSKTLRPTPPPSVAMPVKKPSS